MKLSPRLLPLVLDSATAWPRYLILVGMAVYLTSCSSPAPKWERAATTKDSAELAAFAADSEPRVRGEVASNPNVSTTVLGGLASDKNAVVRLVAAGNPNMPPQLLASMLNDPDPNVVLSAAGNLQTPNQDVLQALARKIKSEWHDERLAVCRAIIQNWVRPENTTFTFSIGRAKYTGRALESGGNMERTITQDYLAITKWSWTGSSFQKSGWVANMGGLAESLAGKVSLRFSLRFVFHIKLAITRLKPTD